MGKMWTEKRTMYVTLTNEDKDELISKINESGATAEGLRGDLEATTKQLKSSITAAENVRDEALRTLGNGKMNKTVDVTFSMIPELKKVYAVMPNGNINEKLCRDMTQKEIEECAQLNLFPESAEGVVPEAVVEVQEGEGEEIPFTMKEELTDDPDVDVVTEGENEED